MLFFLIKTEEIPIFFSSSKKKRKPIPRAWWRVLSNYLESLFTGYLRMTRTVPLNCSIKAEIRVIDSQSDLRILL